MTPGIYFVLAAMVASITSARLFSRQDRGTPASRLLLVLGLGLWILAAFFLPPVSLLERVSESAWITIPLRAVGAYLVGTLASKLAYALVP